MGGGSSKPAPNPFDPGTWKKAAENVGLIDDSDDDTPSPPACSTYRPTLNNTDANKLHSFDPAAHPSRCNNKLGKWIGEERTKFCEIPANFEKDPGGGKTCKERNLGKDLATTYCGTGDRIKSAGACTKEYLGDDDYVILAKMYCESEDGQANPWCSCFNVMSDVCDVNPNAAGCPEKALTYDVLVDKTPEGFRSEWSGREPCYGAVCQEVDGSKYLPEGNDINCKSSVQICGYTITAENLNKSTIDAKCNMGGREFDKDGNLINPGTPAAQYVSNLPPSVGNYLPLSFGDITGDDPNKKIGAGASVASSCMICVCILVLILLVSSDGNSGNSGKPTRYRR